MVTPGNENNCHDKLGEIIQKAKKSAWEIANTPYGFVGKADLDGKPAITQFYFIAPGGKDPNDYNEMVMLDDLVESTENKLVISYQREITDNLKPGFDNPKYKVGLWFRYEDHAFRCSTYLVTQLAQTRVPPYWLITNSPMVITPGHWSVELEELYKEKSFEALTNFVFNSHPDATAIKALPPDNTQPTGYYKVVASDFVNKTNIETFVDTYTPDYVRMFAVADEEQTNIACTLYTTLKLFYCKKTFKPPDQVKWRCWKAQEINSPFSFAITPPMLWYYWKWVYEGEPKIIWVEERKEVYNYKEGVLDMLPMEETNPYYHPFDRARWEKKLEMNDKCYIKEGRIYRVTLELPTNNLETKFSLEEYEIDYDPTSQKFEARGWKKIGEGQDDLMNMSGPLNPWVGTFPLPHKLHSEIVINDQEPNVGGNDFQGRFAINAPQWSLGTILGTGYTPVRGQNINVKLENAGIKVNGMKIDPLNRPWCSGAGYVNYDLRFQTSAPLSPHWGNLFLFIVVPPRYYDYRKG